jgi:CxxC motif-containing protein (DUF1111 family)
MTSPRVAPPLVGLGLLELIPEEQILAPEAAADAEGGMHGTPNRVWSREQGKVVLGRFGWKAGVPTVRQQVAEAFAIDLGLSSSLVDQPAGDCTAQQPACRNAPDGGSARHGGHEVADALLDLVAFYAAFADVPAAPPPATGSVRDGEPLFRSIGCPACHRPSFVTGPTGWTTASATTSPPLPSTGAGRPRP